MLANAFFLVLLRLLVLQCFSSTSLSCLLCVKLRFLGGDKKGEKKRNMIPVDTQKARSHALVDVSLHSNGHSQSCKLFILKRRCYFFFKVCCNLVLKYFNVQVHVHLDGRSHKPLLPSTKHTMTTTHLLVETKASDWEELDENAASRTSKRATNINIGTSDGPTAQQAKQRVLQQLPRSEGLTALSTALRTTLTAQTNPVDFKGFHPPPPREESP